MPSSPEKHAEYLRERYRTDPAFKAKHLKLVARNRTKHKKWVREQIAAFKKQGCQLCPEREPCCLTAHHLDPKKKDFNIALAAHSGYGRERVLRELAKCACLCENCHRKVHAGILKLTQGGGVRSPRWAHNPETVGSNPTPATIAG